MPNIQFHNGPTQSARAIVVSFDMCGFSSFCNHPDAHAVVPRFISSIFNEVASFFVGTLERFWNEPTIDQPCVQPPNFMKYTGDGALMIWILPESTKERQHLCTMVVATMRRLQQRLANVVPQWEIDWQTHNLPFRSRFGIATGIVYPLKPESITSDLTSEFDDPVDYVGYCINLAVRLQNHCPEVGFIIHEPVLPKLSGLIKWIAHGMKGMRPEPVFVFISDFPAMTLERIKSKFAPVGEESEIRVKAMLQNSGVANLELVQPRFEAHLIGPPGHGGILFLNEIYPEFVPIVEVKDETGKIVGKRKRFYRLVSEGSPLIYNFVRDEACD